MQTDSYALVVDRKVVAKGNKKAMHKLRRQTPGSLVYLTTAPVGGTVS